MTKLVDIVVDQRVLLDIHIFARDVRLGLVVIVVGNEIPHRVVGEELAHLGADLRRERLVGLEDQGGTVAAGDDVRHGEGLARPGHAEQGLHPFPPFDPLAQPFDRLGLIAGRGKVAFQFEGSVFHFYGSVTVLPAGIVKISFLSRSTQTSIDEGLQSVFSSADTRTRRVASI